VRGACSNRGAALLTVLLVLVVVSAASASIAATAGRSKAARASNSELRSLDGLLTESELLIHAWLARESSGTLLPPNATVPRVEIIDWSDRAGGQSVSMRIVAFDQCGMAPIETVRAGSPLRFALPTAVLQAVDRLEGLEPPFGLDDFAAGSQRVYPAADGTTHIELGAWLATHQGTLGTINLSTAPMSIVTQAFRISGFGGDEAVAQARSDGKVPPAPSAVADSDIDIRFVTQSDAWAFRIDLEVGATTRSWWSVFGGSGNDWTLIQRLAIDE